MRAGPQPAVGRLRTRPEFVAVARGRRFHTDRVSVQGLRRAADSPHEGLRLGFTVTKREGHATERNRIRRRLRTAAASMAAPFAHEPADVVVIGRRAVLLAPYPTLLCDLSRALGVVTRPRRAPAAAETPPSPLSGPHA